MACSVACSAADGGGPARTADPTSMGGSAVAGGVNPMAPLPVPGAGGSMTAPAPSTLPMGGIAGMGGDPAVGTAGMGGAGMAGMGNAGMGGATPPITDPGTGLIRGDAPTAASAAAMGPYQVVTTLMGLRDPAEYGTQTLYSPTGAEPPFASIAIVPGFVSPEDAIKAWGPFLASHGIVVLTIGTNSGADSPEIRSTALLAALDTLKAENARAGSPVEGKLDVSRFAVGGWSMGGGGTLLTAAAHPELKAAMALCAWYLSAPFTTDTVPTLMFAGTADGLAGGMSQTFYAAIPESTPKTIFEITGADHPYANTPTGAMNQVGRYGLSWLKVFLEGDDRYRQFLTVSPTGAADFRTTVK